MLPMLSRGENIHAGVRVDRSASPAHAALGDYPSGRGMTWRLAGKQRLGGESDGIMIRPSECDGIMISRSWIVDVGESMDRGSRGPNENRSVMRWKISRSRCAP